LQNTDIPLQIFYTMKKGILFIGIMWLMAGCGPDKQEDNKAVTVSIAPQKYFAEALLPAGYHVNVMVPPGASPATYEPTPRQLRDLKRSAAYIRIGAIEFEQVWMEKIKSNNPSLTIIRADKGIDYIKEGKERDPHIWTSPAIVQKMAANMVRSFQDIFPEDTAVIRKNHQKLLHTIDSTHRVIATQLAPHKGKAFIIYHPALSYFSRDYGIKQIAIEHHGKEPSAHDMEHLMEEGKSMAINTVFIQEQFDQRSAKTIASELSAEVITINPLSEQWAAAMTDIAEKIAASFN
jgi:zinc transport system substrate-binding protein